MRFRDDADMTGVFLFDRIVFFWAFIFFPLIYLHNLWCVLMKKDCGKGELPTNSKSAEDEGEKLC